MASEDSGRSPRPHGSFCDRDAWMAGSSPAMTAKNRRLSSNVMAALVAASHGSALRRPSFESASEDSGRSPRPHGSFCDRGAWMAGSSPAMTAKDRRLSSNVMAALVAGHQRARANAAQCLHGKRTISEDYVDAYDNVALLRRRRVDGRVKPGHDG